ncbi:MAG: heavy metal-binding domain-containing protein [Chitinophagales bacterium]|nr:heavy metal-binding domain-containing protein [Chitinophagales bacterium]
MKTQITTAVLLASVLFIASCASGNSESKNENATEQTASAKYQCPMKCEGEKTYDKPGQCPVCNMDLKRLEN